MRGLPLFGICEGGGYSPPHFATLVVVGKEDTGLLKLTTAIFYAVSSFLIMVVNKQVLTVHGFPSFQVRL